ncbi:hypothetical protein ASPWEDRAFT_151666 [Aspergillus wentii DTO 134E9]|uniref:ASST-domain-containing protein n=1 Tax=Aspergillus wentii DTO 134E9 TaxID=1073089 RepID=A0A1L9RN44_ASPWE|nr:uncharacterized protein ASPWEDRAFT_151666 [Aspergillus wentii DTO 134E9]KAI9925999.1 hypothetical protein MW887_004458 [Aspergillus wentii]OJJ36334.1 hypothetical protein ASPWEDRAFT_151666 [Aspergillus wentii DTO 134E9]
MARSFFLCVLFSLALGERDWPCKSFQTGHWQPPHLSLNATGETDPGYLFIGVRKANEAGTAPTIFDRNGDMVWQGPHGENLNFKMQRLFGQDVITYWDAQPDLRVLGYGTAHILDSTYKEIYTVTLRDNFHTPSGKQFDSYIDGHEHYITPQNTMLVSALNFTQADTSHLRRGTPDMWVLDSLFYEIDIKTNKVLFKWDALEHIPISKSSVSVKGGKKLHEAWDAYHINSVTPAKHGYVVNFRHIRSVFYINKDGSVRWQLSGDNENHGDFKCDNITFAWQHDARVYNETDESLVLSLYNNAALDHDDPGPSTGLVIHVDLVNKKAWRIHELTDPTDHLVSATQGSFQLLPNRPTAHMLLGYGSIPKLKEYDADGNIVLRGQFGTDRFSANAYRIFKFPWRATPHWDPALVVNHTTPNTTDLYLSWNGATHYDNWAIFSVPSQTSTLLEGKHLLVHARTGFETHVVLENSDARFIIAVARDGERMLSKSSIADLGQGKNPVCPVIARRMADS